MINDVYILFICDTKWWETQKNWKLKSNEKPLYDKFFLGHGGEIRL